MINDCVNENKMPLYLTNYFLQPMTNVVKNFISNLIENDEEFWVDYAHKAVSIYVFSFKIFFHPYDNYTDYMIFLIDNEKRIQSEEMIKLKNYLAI